MTDENTKTVRIWRNAHLATFAPGLPGMGIVENGAIAAKDGRIIYAGAEAALPTGLSAGAEIFDCEGRWITPGLIDCHTHIVHAGNRAREFEMRRSGATYEEIARAGGGIVSSVAAVRAASADQLIAQSLPRLDALIAEGLTTVEVKSGYGLDVDSELKSLRAARRLESERDVSVRTTFLGAHALPPEYKDNRTGYGIGVSYPPDWGERTMSLRPGDRSELKPGMTFHFMTGLWLEDMGFETTESILITETGVEAFCDFPRRLFIK